jgi:nucleoside-diphosphate-sugar epimerase
LKILITGAFGLVGSTICKLLEREMPGLKITKVKCTDIPPPDEWQTYDFVIHGAGYGQPLKFTADKLKTIEINTYYPDALFNFLKPGGKYLYVSSSEVYSGAKMPENGYPEDDIGTTTPQHPRACYIEGKRCGEAICMAYREQGYDVKIARLALAYGPGTKKGDTRVINQLIEQALTKKEIQLMDSGGAHRTYCYVEDAAKLMLKILFSGSDCVYNVGGFSETTIYALATLIASKTDTKVKRGKNKLTGAPENVKLDMSKTCTEFPHTFTSLNDGLDETIKYQKQLYAS